MERTITAESGRRAGAGRRWAACLAVFALLLQLLLPVSAAQAGGLEGALLASICHSSDDSAPAAPDKAVRDHCAFCRLHLVVNLPAPPTAETLAEPLSTASYTLIPAGAEGTVQASLQSPQTRRGPPPLS